VTVYTLGIWTVRPGSEDAFVEAWHDMARHTKADFPAASAVLLRDRERPNLFISHGPWQSTEEVAAWRGSAAFRDGVARIRETLDGFEPHTMDPVLVIDADRTTDVSG
jgi:heme-degrading monooxygenase HmoA